MPLVVSVVLIVLLSPVVLGLQCKTETNQPSDGWILFRGTGLTYYYYDLSKKTSVQFPSLQTTNNPLATTVKAIHTEKAHYFAYTSDLKFPTFSKNADSTPDKNGIVSVTSSSQGVWLMYSNVFFPPLSSDRKSIADPSTAEWKWLDLTPSRYAYFMCVTLKGTSQLKNLMDLLAASQASVHLRKISASSPFKTYITIDASTPAKTLNKAREVAKKCKNSMPSGFEKNCYFSTTFSQAKVSVFSRQRFITSGYHQFCFDTTANKNAVLQSKPLWPNFPSSPIPQSQITAVTVPGAQPMACVGDLVMMKDKPGKSSLLVCFHHRELWLKLKVEGLETVEHCLPHETHGNITVLSTILPELPKFNFSFIAGGSYHRTVGSVLKDEERFSDDLGSIKTSTFTDTTILYDSLEESLFRDKQPVRSRPHQQRKTRPVVRTVTKVQDLWTFDQKVRQNDDPVLALFCYDWCRYCKKFRSLFKNMANNPALRHVTFVDVDLKLNHLPEAFNVLISPTLRYKPSRPGYNSQKRWFSDYDLAGYRTIEGQMNVKNILQFIQSVEFSATSNQNDEEDWAKDIRETRHQSKESSFSSSANNSILSRIVMRAWEDDSLTNVKITSNKHQTSKGLWVGLFTSLIDGLVGRDKSHRFLITSDDLGDVARDLQMLKNYKTEEQWMENPLVKNIWREKTGHTRPKRKEREAFKVICDYVTKAIKDTATELQRMTGQQKIEQSFLSIKNNLDKYLKLLKGKITEDKRLGKTLVGPVQEMLKYIGFLQPKDGNSQLFCKE